MRLFSKPEISVVVPCRNHARELVGCLEALERQDFDAGFEVLVIDAGGDGVAAAVSKFARVRLVASNSPLTPAEARNLGVTKARAGTIAFTDADCRPAPGWVTAAHAAVSKGDRLAGGPVLDALPWHPMAVIDNLLQFADCTAARPVGTIQFLPGANVAAGRDTLSLVGGFPTVLGASRSRIMSGEDSLLSEAVRSRWPHGVRFVPEMSVRHIGRTNLSDFLRHHYRFGFARAWLDIDLKDAHRRWGRRLVALPAVVLKRASYIGMRVVRWRPAALPGLLLLSPLALAGLVAWALGFRNGLLNPPGGSPD